MQKVISFWPDYLGINVERNDICVVQHIKAKNLIYQRVIIAQFAYRSTRGKIDHKRSKLLISNQGQDVKNIFFINEDAMNKKLVRSARNEQKKQVASVYTSNY